MLAQWKSCEKQCTTDETQYTINERRCRHCTDDSEDVFGVADGGVELAGTDLLRAVHERRRKNLILVDMLHAGARTGACQRIYGAADGATATSRRQRALRGVTHHR